MARTLRLLSFALLFASCARDRPLDYCIDDAGAKDAAVADLAAPRDLGVDLGNPDLFDWNCPNPPTFIITVDANHTISRFRPDTLTFTDIGRPSCPTGINDSAFSMAVARDGTAWVNFQSGNIFLIDTKTAACKPSGYAPGQLGFQNFGMAFSTDAVGSSAETLFVAPATFDLMGNPTDTHLAFIDTQTLLLQLIAPMNGDPELTGTGDARLWGFFPDTLNPTVAEIDKTTAMTTRVYPMPTLAGTPNDWAFATWAGDFYIFLQRSTDASTNVFHLRASDGNVSVALQNTGRHIVGAGVSTCSPFGP